MTTSCEERLGKVVEYIDANLDGDLSVATLCRLAGFSKFHFHRQFSAVLGLSVHGYVQLARMTRAAHWLAYRRGRSVTEVALDCGYDSLEAFSRAFRRHFGMAPSRFRRHPDWSTLEAVGQRMQQGRQSVSQSSLATDAVRVVTGPEIPVALLRHHGDPATLGDSLRRFIQWRKDAGLPPRVSATYNIFHDDPDAVAAQDFRLDLCAACTRPVTANPYGVVPGLIPAGRCASLAFTGGDDSLRQAAQLLYAVWLPGSGETLRDYPLYLQRLSFYPDVPEAEAQSVLLLPLAGNGDA
ncbi:GyrI-like domain-containing protein [Magnetospirillum sp. 64-120]|uniref:AraC family transcriptional regulator n=1 Tax=Magnetospirillum sp. 64-120 TaxID=1895778 RepID=UPI000927444E|nr:AraC family transcriptional regulator [Magnetospirillum sp. 64-120]OJX79625.1 MAG: hypothetical protein BGO92_14330 [Magnetospirillum sp. 64-120]